MSPFRGMLPALVTPVRDDQRLNESAFVELLARLYRYPIAGVYVAGQTGEGLLLNADCRKRLAELAVRHSPSGKTVIVHVGAAGLEQAIDLARHAAAAGAHGVSSLTPAGLSSFEEVLVYYRRLAAASALPFFVYYFPSVAPAVSSPDQLLQLCGLPSSCSVRRSPGSMHSPQGMPCQVRMRFAAANMGTRWPARMIPSTRRAWLVVAVGGGRSELCGPAGGLQPVPGFPLGAAHERSPARHAEFSLPVRLRGGEPGRGLRGGALGHAAYYRAQSGHLVAGDAGDGSGANPPDAGQPGADGTQRGLLHARRAGARGRVAQRPHARPRHGTASERQLHRGRGRRGCWAAGSR